MQPTPVFLPENFDGQRSLAGYSSRGNKELDTTEQLNTFVLFIYLLPYFRCLQKSVVNTGLKAAKFYFTNLPKLN